MRESIIALAKAGYNTQQINAILGSGSMVNNNPSSNSLPVANSTMTSSPFHYTGNAQFLGPSEAVNAYARDSVTTPFPPSLNQNDQNAQTPALMSQLQHAVDAQSYQHASIQPIVATQQAGTLPQVTNSQPVPSQSVIDYIQTMNRNNTSFDLPPNTVTADSVLDNMLNESIGYNTLPQAQKGVNNNG